MKHFKYFTGLAAATVILFASCNYKDKGMLDLVTLPDIVIDTTGIPLSHSVLVGDVLEIEPIVTKETESINSIKYEWWLTQMPGTDFKSKEIISTEKNLNVPINVLADVDFYSLWYRATDTITGLMKGVVFRVVVEGISNQGLVVADSEDGIHSDFSLVQDSLFTENWVERGTTNILNTKYKRDQFYTANGTKFDGIVHSLFAQRLYFKNLYKYLLHGASQYNAFRINTLDYSLIAQGKELFYDADINLNIKRYFQNGPNGTWIMNENKLSSRGVEPKAAADILKFGLSVPGTYTPNKHIAVHSVTAQNAIYYDEVLGKFLYFGSSLSANSPPASPASVSAPFDPTNLPGYTVLGGGLGNLSEVRFVMKKDNYYGMFALSSTAVPQRQVDISNAPDIANAVSFVFPIDQAVIYYATPTTVYSIRIAAGTAPVYTNLYTSPEPITMFEMLRKSGFKAVPLTERCLLVVTYNGTEGKVTALPIPDEGFNLGLIDASRKATFGGFKKISAVAVQE